MVQLCCLGRSSRWGWASCGEGPVQRDRARALVELGREGHSTSEMRSLGVLITQASCSIVTATSPFAERRIDTKRLRATEELKPI